MTPKSKVRIEENIENKVFQIHEYNPKQFLNPTPTPKRLIRAQKSKKMTPKLNQIQSSELRET